MAVASRRLVCLYHYIGGFDGGIAARIRLWRAHMTRGKNQGIIDAVAHKGYPVGRVAAELPRCASTFRPAADLACLGDALAFLQVSNNGFV